MGRPVGEGSCARASETQLSSGLQAASGLQTQPGRGGLLQFPYLLCLQWAPLGHQYRGTMCTWANPGKRNFCQRTGVPEASQLLKVPSSRFLQGLEAGGWRPKRTRVLILTASRTFHPSSFKTPACLRQPHAGSSRHMGWGEG